jgi:hypothetical protein
MSRQPAIGCPGYPPSRDGRGIEEGLSEGELRSGSRVKKVTRVRGFSCGLAVKGMGCAGAEVARFGGVITSAVNRAARLEPRFEGQSDQ